MFPVPGTRVAHERPSPVVAYARRPAPCFQHSGWSHLFEGFNPRVMNLHESTKPEEIKKLYNKCRRAYNDQKTNLDNKSGRERERFLTLHRRCVLSKLSYIVYAR